VHRFSFSVESDLQRSIMENAFLKSTAEVLKHFDITEGSGLSSNQVAISRQKHGSNSLPEDPPTPLWQLVLEQFKDQLVLILLGSAAISFVLALFEEGDDWTAFVDPVVVSNAQGGCAKH
jgi:Ca2+ transporting ATPase